MMDDEKCSQASQTGGPSVKGKKVVLLSAVLCFLSLAFSLDLFGGTLQDIKDRGRLIAGVKIDFPPFGFLDKEGVHRGFDVDLVKAISKELFGGEERVEFIPVTTGNRVAVLTSKRIDLIAATMSITPERMREVDFSTPYFMTGQMILVQGDSRIAKYEDLTGKKIATIRNSIGDMTIGQMIRNIQRVQFEDNYNAVQALKEHRVEAFVQDYVLLLKFLQEHSGLKIADLEPFRITPYGLGVRKGDREWLDFINTTLAAIAQFGESEILLDKWFDQKAKALLKSFKK